VTANLSPESFEPVYDAWMFDLATYTALGLRLGKLTDPDPTAPLPRLRMAAAAYATDPSSTGADTRLYSSYRHVGKALTTAEDSLRHALDNLMAKTLRHEHSAIQAYVERNPRSAMRRPKTPEVNPYGRPLLDVMLQHADQLELVLVRPTDAAIDPPTQQQAAFQEIALSVEGQTLSASVAQAAKQLVGARVGLTTRAQPPADYNLTS
jgi:hypothetical protein